MEMPYKSVHCNRPFMFRRSSNIKKINNAILPEHITDFVSRHLGFGLLLQVATRENGKNQRLAGERQYGCTMRTLGIDVHSHLRFRAS